MATRPITEDERALVQHISMFGCEGIPLRRLKSGWIWGFRSVKGPPVVFKTKRAAVASFEAFMGILREALGAEAKERGIAELRAKGWSEDEIASAIASAERETAQ